MKKRKKVKKDRKTMATVIGNLFGAGSAGTGVYFGGIPGLSSAVEIASGLKALGSLVTLGAGGMGTGVIACAALPIAGGVAAYGLYRFYTR
jgi:hypothetical protein